MMIWGCFKSNSDVTSPDSSTQTSKISKLHSSTDFHQRPVSKIQKNDVCKFQTESEVIIFTNPNPYNPCILKGETPKVIIHLHCLIPRNTGKLMTPAKKKNNLQQQKCRKFGNQVTILRSIFDFHRHQKSTRVHHTAHCRVHTRTPRRLKVVCFLCAFLRAWWYITDYIFSEGPQQKSSNSSGYHLSIMRNLWCLCRSLLIFTQISCIKIFFWFLLLVCAHSLQFGFRGCFPW